MNAPAVPPRVRHASSAVAGVLALSALLGLASATDDLPVALTVAVLLLILSAGLAFRWPGARGVALVVFSISAGFAVLSFVYQVFLLSVISPLGWRDYATTAATLLFCAAYIASALWLQSAQAKAYYARAGRT